MEATFDADSLAVGPNLSGVAIPGWNLNISSHEATPGQPSARTLSAGAILLLALVGNGLLLHRLRCGGCCCGAHFGRRRRKMDFLLAHLAIADLYGCGLVLLSQLPPADGETGRAAWPAGDAPCRLLWLLQGSGLLASSHMLVLIAIERRHMVSGLARPPPAPPSFLPARGALAALGWLLALLLALPQAFVYRQATAESGGRCLSIFAQRPRWHGQTYAVYWAVAGFVAPACLLGGTCGRILSALSAPGGAKDDDGAEPSRGVVAGSARHYGAELPGASAVPRPPPPPLMLRLLPIAKCALPSPPAPRTLPRARARALQLTLALATLFALCGFPRFLLELALAFAPSEGGGGGANEARAAVGSILAATNCALNPYVCLLFHSHGPWARRLQRRLCRCPDGQPRRRARHRHRPPPPRAAAEPRPGRWLCPCQTKPPPVSTVVYLEGGETPGSAASESGF